MKFFIFSHISFDIHRIKIISNFHQILITLPISIEIECLFSISFELENDAALLNFQISVIETVYCIHPKHDPNGTFQNYSIKNITFNRRTV